MKISAGSKLGPYEVLSPLGAGGMGEVWRARDPRLGREVAVKVLPSELASDSGRLKRFEKEARSASALNHPNIVTIYEIGSADSVAYIAMELVEGKTLRELLFAGPLPIKRVLALAAQVAEGLARAHEAGIVHRDLKPENVMVTKDGLVKILDFGLAKLTYSGTGSDVGTNLPTETGTGAGVVLGTVGYMSPEQASGLPVDFRSDQFSFGSILYEMTTGKRAFQKKTVVETLSAIIREEPEPIGKLNADVPTPYRWTVERCLAKEPEDRYASTKDLARDLATVRDHLSESLTPSELNAGRSLPRRLRGGLALSGLAALVALAVGLLFGIALRPNTARSFPRFQQLTFRQGTINTARFTPDGQTIVYGSIRDGRVQLFSTRPGATESRPLGLAADIASISSSGQMALQLGALRNLGTLAEASLAGGAPREILENVQWADWAPDGKSLAVVRVVGKAKRMVRRLEFPIGKTLFESEGFIGRPRFSREGNRILFADGPETLRVIDLNTSKASTLLEKQSLSGYGWSPKGTEVWATVVSGATTELRGVSPHGEQRLMATFPGRLGLQDVASDGRVLAERISQGNVMMALVPGETAERDLSWLDASSPADISPDGGMVLFTEAGAGSGNAPKLYRRDTVGGPAVALGEGEALALSPDKKFALARVRDETFLVPIGPGQRRRIAAPGIRFERGATFFSAGRRLLLSGAQGGSVRLYIQDTAGGDPRPASPEGVFLPWGTHTVSPNGRLVAASTTVEKEWRLYSLDGPPDYAGPIPGLLENEEPVRWDADGEALLVLSENRALYRLDLSSEHRQGHRQLVKEFRSLNALFPTPDGKAYVYSYGNDLSDLFLIEGLK